MTAKLVFILYDSRSGSTYLSALLNRYKGVSVSLESAFVSRIIEYKKAINQENPDAIIEYLQKEVQFRELGLDLDELRNSLAALKSRLNKKALIECIVWQYFSTRDAEAECLVIKHPPYAYLASVIEMFPEVQFLQIIRDGRAVFNSKKKTTSLKGHKMATNPLKAAWDWRLKLQKAERFKGRTISICYEDLIQNQEQTLQFVLQKLGISDQERQITKNQSDYFQRIGKAQKGLHENVSKSPQTDVIDKWKQELSDAEIGVYNLVNKQYLQKYNYCVDQTIPKFYAFAYGFYLLKFTAEKMKNILLLLQKPSLLKLKFTRNYYLFKNND